MEGPFSIVSAAFEKKKSSKNRAREENPGTSFTRWPTKIYNTIQHTGHTTIQQWRDFFTFCQKLREKKTRSAELILYFYLDVFFYYFFFSVKRPRIWCWVSDKILSSFGQGTKYFLSTNLKRNSLIFIYW